MSHKQNNITSEARKEAFDEFMLTQFEQEHQNYDTDDLPDLVPAWQDGLSDDEYNAYVDKFSDFTNSK